MPDTMIERAGQKLFEHLGGRDLFGSGDVLIIDERVSMEDMRDAVRAVLTAMREPTEGMDLAACKVTMSTRYGDGSSVPVAIWQEMIDAALAEEG